ncbi:acid phosphatase [Xylariomycetidae sp. FL2044]|nr:acid phosphatase [Xylariomycetidae sp. FL2044]
MVNVMRAAAGKSCDSVYKGFQCETDVSHSWGQYSPFYSVPSNISASTPEGCEITFAQMLSRHAARDPTAGKTLAYAAVVDQIHNGVVDYSKKYKFIKNYNYSLGADQLTLFGEQQMVNSGVKFYKRYEHLARNITPFVRTAGQERVVYSALNWTQGFHEARSKDKHADSPDAWPYRMLIIPEGEEFNNTLSHESCPAFEQAKDRGTAAQNIWADIFATPITERLNEGLPGANLTNQETLYMMDLCPFETVAHDRGRLSPFCYLYTVDEWHGYDYYQSLGKWYGFGDGNPPLGPTQGVGFVNELVARLTGQPVQDHTTTNSTLDGSERTFPLDGVLYADFSHDNDMAGVFAALGLYNGTKPLSNTTKESPTALGGYSASWTVPFAARMYVEKMRCEEGGGGDEEREGEEEEELVRILVNDRVIPLENCDADGLGRCALSKFVDSLAFARDGGRWDLCYA